jgi:quercetin dioxygenase-like cupin family protein
MTEMTATDATASGPAASTQPGAQRTAADEGDAYWFFDSLMVVRSNQPGQPVIIEATVAPGGGAPLHVHTDLDDSFYLVSGRLAMRCGEQAFTVSPAGTWPCPTASRTPSASSATSPPSCCRSTPTTRS